MPWGIARPTFTTARGRSRPSLIHSATAGRCFMTPAGTSPPGSPLPVHGPATPTTATTKCGASSALNQLTTYTRDPQNRILTQTDPLGRRTTYAYDTSGNLTSTTNP